MLADFGADMVFTTGAGTIIRHFRCRLQRIVSGNGQAAPSRPHELERSPARTRRAPQPRGAGAFSPDASLTANPLLRSRRSRRAPLRAAATAPDRFDTQEAARWRLPGAMLQQADEREAPVSRTGRAIT